MKKGVKISLISIISFFLLAGIGYAGFLFYVRSYIKNAPPEAQLKAGEALYNDCIQEGGSEGECQKYLKAGVGQALINSKDEFLKDALNKNLPLKERASGLTLYNTIMRQDYNYLTDEEIGIYFGFANDKEDLKEIRDMGMIYLLEAPSKNKEIISLQKRIMNNENAKENYRFKAFKTVIKYKNSNDIPDLIALMKNYDNGSNIKISNSLCWYWPEIKEYVPNLIDEFKNKNNNLALRYNSLNIIKCLAQYHNFTDKALAQELENFLQPDNRYIIQSITQSTLNNLTDKNYKIEEKGEGDMFEMWGVK